MGKKGNNKNTNKGICDTKKDACDNGNLETSQYHTQFYNVMTEAFPMNDHGANFATLRLDEQQRNDVKAMLETVKDIRESLSSLDIGISKLGICSSDIEICRLTGEMILPIRTIKLSLEKAQYIDK